jgi:hypothetical protein
MYGLMNNQGLMGSSYDPQNPYNLQESVEVNQPNWGQFLGQPSGHSPGNFDFGPIPGLMKQGWDAMGGMEGFGNLAGGGLKGLGKFGGMGLKALGQFGGAGLGQLGSAAGILGKGAMGALGQLGGAGMGALGALGPAGLAVGGLLGGMAKQKTWNPIDVVSGGTTHLANQLKGSKSGFARGLGNMLGGAASFQKNLLGSKGTAGKLWDSTLGKRGIGGAIGKIFSDVKLKENVAYLGKSPMGINVYEFDYKDKSYGSGRYRGVMAHEVPWAAERARNGYLRVDYSKVDVDFTTANK